MTAAGMVSFYGRSSKRHIIGTLIVPTSREASFASSHLICIREVPPVAPKANASLESGKHQEITTIWLYRVTQLRKHTRKVSTESSPAFFLDAALGPRHGARFSQCEDSAEPSRML